MSRSSKSGRNYNTSPLHSKLSYRSSSETHLNRDPMSSSPSKTLVNGMTLSPTHHYTRSGHRLVGGYTYTPQQRRESDEGVGYHSDTSMYGNSVPCVQKLTSYFENLTREGEESRKQSFVREPFSGNLKKGLDNSLLRNGLLIKLCVLIYMISKINEWHEEGFSKLSWSCY